MEQDDIERRSLRRRRTNAQLLAGGRGRGVEEIVSHLLAVQAQDLHAARLALRARSSGLAARDVDRALTVDRSLVVAWLGRGTLHLVHRDDYPWLLALTAPTRTTSNRRRLQQEGVSLDDAERGVSAITTALADEGPLTRPELAARIGAQDIPTAGQATPHLLTLAALRGIIVLGPLKGNVQAFALTEDWLGTRPILPGAEARPAALSRLALRYLRGHASATPEDLAVWAGLSLGEARMAFDFAEAPEPHDAGTTGSPLRLLPAFDPYLLGWRDRSFMVSDAYKRRVHPGGGMLRATAIHDGEAIGTWSRRRTGGRLTVDLQAFTSITDEVAGSLQEEAGDVARFEGLALSR